MEISSQNYPQSASELKIEASWKKILKDEFNKEYLINIRSFLVKELQKKKVIYPHGRDIFNAFNYTPFPQLKVVIIGQDPYHGPNQAHGLCFSVQKGVAIPPSLQNIYKELRSDLNLPIPSHGQLTSWAQQGVLLLNAVLTVEQGKAGSQHGIGWEIFTDKVVEVINEQKQNVVFLLWGSPAQKKGAQINEKKHLVIKAPHPSPLSAYRGFFGHRPFSRTNQYLLKHGQSAIDWNIPNI